MPDVVAVALITGGLSLVSAAVGAVTTYKVSRRSTDATIETARAHAEVELEKVKAENERLRVQHQEDERRNRQGTYHNMIALLYRIASVEPGGNTAAGKGEKLLREWRLAAAGIQLFGSPGVRSELEAVGDVMSSGLDESFSSRVVEASQPLIDAMREDVRQQKEQGV